MPKFIVERDIPGAAELTPTELQGIAQKSASVLRELGPQIQWVQSFIAGDRMYCIYIAPNADMIREHARRGGFPADKITRIEVIIDPTTAEGRARRETAFSAGVQGEAG
jgi:hypothetical protein